MLPFWQLISMQTVVRQWNNNPCWYLVTIAATIATRYGIAIFLEKLGQYGTVRYGTVILEFYAVL